VREELRHALTLQPDLETTRRIEQLLARLAEATVSPNQLRFTRRAIVILERIGNEQARQILTGLRYGVPSNALMDEAQAALERLKQKDE
jgi:hypothetical protein